jgi:hypothetical protein
MKEKLQKTALDLGAIAGIGLFVFGLAMIYRPLAPLVGGLVLSAVCIFIGYDRVRKAGRS